jgi:hypothetical protein
MPEPESRNLFRRMSAKVDRLNDQAAATIQAFVNRVFQTERFRATKEAVLAVEGAALLSIGTTLMQIGESFFAICAFILLGFLLFAKALTANSWVKNLAGCASSVILIAGLITITCLHKPDSEPSSSDLPRSVTVASGKITSGYVLPSRWSTCTNTATG